MNFDTSFEIGKGLTLFAVVNNLFDKDYVSAGRLGITPFSPSVTVPSARAAGTTTRANGRTRRSSAPARRAAPGSE